MLTKSQITMNIYRNPNLLILVLCAYEKAFLGIVTLSGESVCREGRSAKGIIPSIRGNPEITAHCICIRVKILAVSIHCYAPC